MKNLIVSLLLSVFAVAIAEAKDAVRKPNQQGSIELSADAAKTVGNLLRGAEKAGNKSVKFEGGPQVTIYSVGNLSCYFQNDDSVSCSVGQ
ncbi:MAG: hypothetical protein H7328_10370 [Bdellovibrio sp.]|nr:hypothetical protein [Bdellovibrio sp.]